MRGRGGILRGGPNAFAGPPHMNGVAASQAPIMSGIAPEVSTSGPAPDSVPIPAVEAAAPTVQQPVVAIDEVSGG